MQVTQRRPGAELQAAFQFSSKTDVSLHLLLEVGRHHALLHLERPQRLLALVRLHDGPVLGALQERLEAGLLLRASPRVPKSGSRCEACKAGLSAPYAVGPVMHIQQCACSSSALPDNTATTFLQVESDAVPALSGL